MPRTAITVQTPTRAGLNATYTTSMTAGAGNGVSFPYTGEQALHVKNTDVAAKTLTVKTATTLDGLVVADRTVTVPANSERFVLPGSPDVCRQSDGSVFVEFDSVTGVSVAALAL